MATPNSFVLIMKCKQYIILSHKIRPETNLEIFSIKINLLSTIDN